MKVHQLRAGRIHEGDWLEADLAPGYTLAIIDGPYALQMAAWDKMKLDDLAEWYRPHLSRVSELLAPSASVYLWNTAAGWARIDPVMRGLGWTFRALIVWDKVHSLGRLSGAVGWQNVTEFAGFYTRGEPVSNGDETTVWRLSNTGNPACSPASATRERLFTEEYYTGARAGRRIPLHPTQKPLIFAERMILASTRPGDQILVPFGGTNREAVVCEWLARTSPDEARGYDACELNADGKDYIGPVLRQIAGEDMRPTAKNQVSMFAPRP